MKNEVTAKIYRAAVVGGGFSGLTATALLSERFGGENVLLLERNDRVGERVLATGNGRCNLPNVVLSPGRYHSVLGADVGYALGKYGNKSLIDYFRALGILTAEEEGRIYPRSFQAGSVLDVLRAEVARRGAVTKTQTKVTEAVFREGVFRLRSDGGETFGADALLLAVGGKAGKAYGTDGSSYGLALGFGHSVTPLSPAIVQLKTESRFCKGLKGIRQKGKAYACDGEKRLSSAEGDILFTDYGVSGNAVFVLSSYLVGAERPSLEVDFLPEMQETEIVSFLKQKRRRFPEIPTEELLCGVVNKQIARMLAVNFATDKKREAETLARAAKRLVLPVTGTMGFDQAQVTRGGIPFSEFDPSTMESRRRRGLFFAGEVVDADGDCGGYNLQWAYSSARCAVDGISAFLGGGEGR